MADLIVGLDLGASYTKMAYRLPDRPRPALVPFDDVPGKRRQAANCLRTAVLFPEGGGDPLVGEPAINSTQRGHLFYGFKDEMLQNNHLTPTDVLGRREPVDALDAMVEVVRRVAQFAAKVPDLTPWFDPALRALRAGIVLSVGAPTEHFDHYEKLVTCALDRVGWSAHCRRVRFVTEPVAACQTRITGSIPERVVVFDHGGLTLDLAYARTTGNGQDWGFNTTRRVKWQARRGVWLDCGGQMMDRLLLRGLVRELGGVAALSAPIRQAYGIPFDAAELHDLVENLTWAWVSDDGGARQVLSRLLLSVERLRVDAGGGSQLSDTPVSWRPKDDQTEFGSVPPSWIIEALEPILAAIEAELKTGDGSVNAASVICMPAGGAFSTTGVFERVHSVFGEAILRPVDYLPSEAIAAGLAANVGFAEPPTDTEYAVWVRNSDGVYEWQVVVEIGAKTSLVTLPSDRKRVPDESRVKWKQYRPVDPVSRVDLEVAQRARHGGWNEQGARTVVLRKPGGSFRVYFGLEPESGRRLELRLQDVETGDMFVMQDLTFD